jgi:pimeloyl-ACP methyl ester carboxylesterase
MEIVAVEHDRLVAYERWEALDGQPMFFLHGSPGCRLNRHPDATLWPNLGLHVVTIDRPGYGGSTALPGRRVSHAAGDVAAVADALGLGRFSTSRRAGASRRLVVGSSGGGPHALACAAELGHRASRARRTDPRPPNHNKSPGSSSIGPPTHGSHARNLGPPRPGPPLTHTLLQAVVNAHPPVAGCSERGDADSAHAHAAFQSHASRRCTRA